jgi:Fur family transcriptional regulator, ferric uptake regulator
MKHEKADDRRARLQALIRQAGLRSTQGRVAVLERLESAAGPMSHAELVDELANQGFDKATTYRNLVDMAEVGVLTRVELGDHTWRFELRREGEAADARHPHFVCIDCGDVACVPADAFDVSLSRKLHSGVIGEVTEIVLKGRCRQCQ